MGKLAILRYRVFFLIVLAIIIQNSISARSIVNSFTPINGSEQELSILATETTNTIFAPSHPSLAIDSQENLFLTYRENYAAYSSIVMLRTNEGDEYNVWNLTRNYLYIPNDNDLISSYPAMIFHQDNFYLGISSENESGSFFKILEIDSNDLTITTLLTINSTESHYLNPKIFAYSDSIWFSWLNDIEEHYNLYFTKYNQTTASFSSTYQLSNDTFGNCQNSELFLDENGTCHFVWSQGLEYKNFLFYKSYLLNETSLMNRTVVSNTTYCNNPDIFVETNGQVNIFWSNYTEIAPITLGKRNVHYCTYSKANNWSDIEQIAPYRAVDKTEYIDGENPDVAIDSHGIMWIIYELVEQYPQITGIGVRPRQNGVWLDGEPVTRGLAPCYDPCIVSDNSGTIHCVWLDFRLAYFEIFYLARFDTGIWSTEQQLTKYYIPANKEGAPIFFGILFGTIGVFAILIPTITYYIKRRRINKLIEVRRKEIEND
ncbi:MAG: hypothetical protein ACTSSK_03665 [Candidatus Heimdallarchaeota archaeon]